MNISRLANKILVKNFFLNCMQLATKGKNNMRNSIVNIADKILLRKRVLIETSNGELKNIVHIEQSRHCSFNNFIANSFSAIVVYCFLEKKPVINIRLINDG